MLWIKYHLLLFQFPSFVILYPTQNCGESNVIVRSLTNSTYFIGGIFPTHRRDGDFYVLNEGPILLVSSMMLAIQEINNSTDILPGVKIGFDIRDSKNDILCACNHAIDLLLDKKESSVLIGVVGPASSSLSAAVSTMLLPDFVPQVSYSSTSMSLSKRSVYRNFLRTAPTDAYQAKALIDLVEHFQWTYISLFTSNDEYGRFGREEVRKAAQEKNICFSVDSSFDTDLLDKKMDSILQNIEKSSRIVVLWCDSQFAVNIVTKSILRGITNITWIGTESWGNAFLQYMFKKTTHRIFCLQLKEYPIKFVDNNILNANITSMINCDNPWYREFSKKNFPNGPECASNLTKTLSKRKINQAIGAVYALAYGLHVYLNCSFERCFMPSGDSIDYQRLYNIVVNTSFTVPTSRYFVKFNKNGDFLFPAYDYVFIDQNNFVKFGIWEYNVDKQTIVEINPNIIGWENNVIPKSVCSLNCQPGTYRVNSTVKKCCWICEACPYGYVSAHINQYTCTKCPKSSQESLNKTQCINLTEIRLNIFSLDGLLIVIGSIAGILLTSIVLILYFRYWDKPIIKSSNREMSCIQIFFIKLLLSISFLYFPEPNRKLCLLRTSLFGFLLTSVLALVVVKTYRLLRVFNGTFTKVSRFLENKFQITFTFSIVLIQAVAVFLWNINKPATVQTIPISTSKMFYIICDNEKPVFWISIIYFFVLAIVSGCMAFRARKLPENFKETQSILYAMLTVGVLWLSYLPIQLSVDPHKSIVVFLSINIVSCYSMLIFLYGKKVLYIFYYPSVNSVEFFYSRCAQKVLHSFVENVVQADGSTLNVMRNVVIYNKNALLEDMC